jgi:rhodanese-related sulfurtransferase
MNWYRLHKKAQVKPSPFHGATVYHGCSKEDAQSIIQNGVDPSKSTGGYFGWAFYTTPDKSYAQGAYADFAEEEEITDTKGRVLSFTVSNDANILDLRDPDDFEFYKGTNHEKYLSYPDKSQYIRDRHNVDAIYDRSNDSLMVFNPNILTLADENELV